MTTSKAKTKKPDELVDAPAPSRLSTGIAGLDEVLGGGLLPGRVYLVKGPPGSGKTVFAVQLCFATARAGGHCVFVTMLSESHTMLIANLATFDFYDSNVVAESVTFVSGYDLLEKGGLDGLTRELRAILRKTHARVLVIDTLAAPGERSGSPERLKRFIRELGALCSLLSCTAVCIAPPIATEQLVPTEHVSDGILELTREECDFRSARVLEVVKLRGSANLEGRHAFEISSRGLVVYPRTEARFAAELPFAEPAGGRVPIGIPELDRMLGGGVTAASSTGVLGMPGSGKTLLGLQFLAEGARRGEPGLYFGFYESPPRLVGKAEGVSLPLREYVERGLIELLWQPSLEISIDYLAQRLLEAAARRKARRVVVDGVNAFRTSAFYASRLPRFFTALTNALRALGTTSLLTEEVDITSGELHSPTELSALFENLLLLRYMEHGNRLHRLFSILKVRESDYDSSVRELRISKAGLVITTSSRSAAAIMREGISPISTPPAGGFARLKPRAKRRP